MPKALATIATGLLNHVCGRNEIFSLYSRARSCNEDLMATVTRTLQVRCTISDSDLTRIPATGPVLVTVNHPTGILDGLVVATVLRRVRPDLKILANDLLEAIPEIKPFLIPVSLSATSASARFNSMGMRAAVKHLAAGGALVVFPAGQVSGIRWRDWEISDPEWSATIPRMIRAVLRLNPRLSVLPLYLDGSNSVLFHVAGGVHPKLRLALLPRELLNKRGREIQVRAGHIIPAEKLTAFGEDQECAEYLRLRTYLLAERPALPRRTRRPLRARSTTRMQPIAAPVDSALLRRDIEALPPERKLGESDGLAVYLGRAAELPNVLPEISRLREITFRAAGEGTGRTSDRDAFDEYYDHLFLWNPAKAEIAGAYRLAVAGEVRRRSGVAGLYTATLFSYGDRFLDSMGPSIELGRSFVRLEYQRGFAPLLLLWKGIGRFVALHPECRVLFGPVSISNEYQNVSRELMVTCLERHAQLSEWLDLVAPRVPFRAKSRFAASQCRNMGLDELSSVIADIEPDGRGTPVLLRQYMKLGGRLLGFNVDPQFSNALDGLIVVDLTRAEPKLLERYLGKSQARAFLEFHAQRRAA